MPLVGLEPTISAFERAKTVHALDRAAAVIGSRVLFYFLVSWGGVRLESTWYVGQ
jgi:hypothetical protein